MEVRNGIPDCQTRGREQNREISTKYSIYKNKIYFDVGIGINRPIGSMYRDWIISRLNSVELVNSYQHLSTLSCLIYHVDDDPNLPLSDLIQKYTLRVYRHIQQTF